MAAKKKTVKKASTSVPPVAFRQVMTELKQVGTDQNVKIYKRHGAVDPVFGVSFANLRKLHKKLNTHHPLAQELWDSGNFDAQILATMIADPEVVRSAELDRWVKSLNNYALTDSFVKVAARSRFAHKKAESWRTKKGEWQARAGWMLVAAIALRNDPADQPWLASLIPVIERDIHTSKNRIKDAMNYALISVGGTFQGLRKPALQAASRIGKVEVDHGETGCKTRDATGYIEAMWQRRATVTKKATVKTAAPRAPRRAIHKTGQAKSRTKR